MKRDSKVEFERLRNLLRNRYFENSVIEEAIETRDYNENVDSTKEFKQIGTSVRFEEDVFGDPTHYLDLLFNQTADNIVLGEKKYLVDTMLKQATASEYMERFAYDDLVEIISAKFQAVEPSIIFVPLTLFSRIHLEWMIPLQQNKIAFEKAGHYRMILPAYRNRPLLVWSNKYMPFDNIVVASKQFGEWIAKPKVKDRVRVTLDGLALHVYSVFHFQVHDPQQVLRIDVNPEELDKKRLDKLTRTPIE